MAGNKIFYTHLIGPKEVFITSITRLGLASCENIFIGVQGFRLQVSVGGGNIVILK